MYQERHKLAWAKLAMMGNTPFTQKMMGGSGLPGYDKGGPIKKSGYLTDKKGKPYARVRKGGAVVPRLGLDIPRLSMDLPKANRLGGLLMDNTFKRLIRGRHVPLTDRLSIGRMGKPGKGGKFKGRGFGLSLKYKF